MINIAEDICSMTEFKRRTSAILSRLRGTDRAVVLTTNGRADVVIQDAASYQKLLDRLQAYEAPQASAAKNDSTPAEIPRDRPIALLVNTQETDRSYGK